MEEQEKQKQASLAMKELMKKNDRAEQMKRDAASYQELEAEKKVVNEKKRQMQDVNRQVWLDQIALNRMHKKLNL